MAEENLTILADQNPWWKRTKSILEDSRIINFQNAKFKREPSIKFRVNLTQDAIYTLRGPRQIGKTTLIKLLIKDLIVKGTDPQNILFYSCESCDRKKLNALLQTYLDWRMTDKDRKYIFLDEVCSVEDWNKEMLYFSNKGQFKNCFVFLSGSHAIDVKESAEMLPGRKGETDDPKDKVLLPMKFSEFATLQNPDLKDKLFTLGMIKATDKQQKIFQLLKGEIPKEVTELMVFKKELDSYLEQYLLCGGIPKVVNEFLSTGKISKNSYDMYLTAVMGDLARWGLKSEYAKRIIQEIFNSYSTPVSWDNIKKNTDLIGSHTTVAEYVKIFDDIFFTTTINLISQEGKVNYTKNKKIYIQDPFIFHAFNGFANNTPNKMEFAKSNLLDLQIRSQLVETVILNHLGRFAYGLNPHDLFEIPDYLFFYRDSADKEIDFVLKFNAGVFPFEVKYQESVSNSDFIPFRSFKTGLLLTKNTLNTYNFYGCVPISIFLLLI